MHESTDTKWLAEAFALLAENLPAGVVIADRDGTVRFANHRALGLLQAADVANLAGKTVDSLFVESETLPFTQVLAQDQPWTRLLRVNTAANEQLILESTLVPLRNSEESMIALLLEMPGVQSQVERQYVQAEKLAALDHLVAGVAHELNNPLTVILGYSELLLSRPLEDDLRSRLSLIVEKTERCRRIVDNLMRFSRRQDTLKTPSSINEILMDTLALCEYQLSMEHVKLQLELGEGLPRLPLQRRDMQSVLLSLINNAHQALIKVPEERRRITLRTELQQDRVRLTFADTGCGVPESDQHKIFDPFFTTRELGEGLGLGLSVSYGIVMEHRGRIWLDNSSSEGSTFIIDLPI